MNIDKIPHAGIRRHERCKALGICTNCSTTQEDGSLKGPPLFTSTLCRVCRDAANAKNRALRREAREFMRGDGHASTPSSPRSLSSS